MGKMKKVKNLSYLYVLLMFLVGSCINSTPSEAINWDEIEQENNESERLKGLIDRVLQESKRYIQVNPDSTVILVDSCFNYCSELDSLNIYGNGAFISESINQAKYNKGLAFIELNKISQSLEIFEDIYNSDSKLVSSELCEIYFSRKDWSKTIQYCQPTDCDSCVYKLAYSIYKTEGKIKAIEFLKKQVDSTDEKEAIEFYNKLNPIYKVREFSHSECCDGSRSFSRGRGTCSHHGGVCSEIFEIVEKRKY